MRYFAVPIITTIICIVLWIFYFEWVANSDMPTWLKYILSEKLQCF